MCQSPCPFCHLLPERILQINETGVLVRDGFPVSLGHSLVIPRRHVSSFFDLVENERAELFALLVEGKRYFDALYAPAGYNIGVNDGKSAGQTVPHLHIHLIPRYEGDSVDPRGGVCWVIPSKAVYWDY